MAIPSSPVRAFANRWDARPAAGELALGRAGDLHPCTSILSARSVDAPPVGRQTEQAPGLLGPLAHGPAHRSCNLRDHPPGPALFRALHEPRPEAPDRRLDRHDRGQTLELPARQVLEKIEQLAVPGDHPHHGRDRPILQWMSVNHRDARVVLNRPSVVLSLAAEGHFLMIKEEIFVHPAERGDHF